MLSIVPLLAGGGLLKLELVALHQNMFNNLLKRVILMGFAEELPIAVSLEDLANKTAIRMPSPADTLNVAIENFDENKSPSRE